MTDTQLSCKSKEPIWVERYRPQTVEECILPKRIKDQFQQIVDTGEIPNMLFYGTSGVGKTTVAKAICDELQVDWMIINISEESGIDTLRTKIRDFASTVSLSESNNRKCVVLDEFDHASSNLQAGLRGFIEGFSSTCSFIMTCNYPNRIMDAIHSRTAGVDFTISNDEIPKLQAKLFQRVSQILDNEKVEYEKKPIIRLIGKWFPDNRRIINQLQEYGRAGKIDEGILNDLQEINIETLIGYMKGKKFKEIRQWCAENAKNDLTSVYTKIYRVLKDHVSKESIPEAILILEDYQRNTAIVPDKEIHVCAMCVQMMMNLEFE